MASIMTANVKTNHLTV